MVFLNLFLMTTRLNDSSTTPRRAGARAESCAIDFLKSKGLIELSRNYHSRYGEIDLIMQDGQILVFIEVRYRNETQYMKPLESIDNRKVRKIIKTSQDYIQKNITSPRYCRFDIISLTGSLDKPIIDWIQDAFDADV